MSLHSPLESLWSQQGIDEIDQQTECDQAAQPIIQHHGATSFVGIALETLTAHDVGQATHEKDHRQDEEEQVDHIDLLSTNRVLDRAV
jgi:hypothetical protein